MWQSSGLAATMAKPYSVVLLEHNKNMRTICRMVSSDPTGFDTFATLGKPLSGFLSAQLMAILLQCSLCCLLHVMCQSVLCYVKGIINRKTRATTPSNSTTCSTPKMRLPCTTAVYRGMAKNAYDSNALSDSTPARRARLRPPRPQAIADSLCAACVPRHRASSRSGCSARTAPERPPLCLLALAPTADLLPLPVASCTPL